MKGEELVARKAKESYYENVGAPKGNKNASKQSLLNLTTIDIIPNVQSTLETVEPIAADFSKEELCEKSFETKITKLSATYSDPDWAPPINSC